MALGVFDFNAPRRLPLSTGPNAVRSYIGGILINKYDTTPAFADEIAGLWNFGRVRDLCQASAKSFSHLFGPELGPIIFHSVREDVLADWWKSSEGLLGAGKLMVISRLFSVVPYLYSLLPRVFLEEIHI
ncbi:hypothetical protein BBP40_011323 [Aspergillus hancockii]|nr:hypothetical protein BBP40_011323 [Aspergillus hancockii]